MYRILSVSAVSRQSLLSKAAALQCVEHMIWDFVYSEREEKEVAKYIQLDTNLEWNSKKIIFFK